MSLLTVCGPSKCGTSSLVGILNCHPKVFVLYEVALRQFSHSKYSTIFVNHVPKALEHLDSGDPIKAEEGLQGVFAAQHYQYLGTKLLSDWLPDDEFTAHGRGTMIYITRDIRTWLSKNILQHFLRDAHRSMAEAAEIFVRRFLQSFQFPNCLRLRMEDLVLRNDECRATLDGFLGLDIAQWSDHWWEKVSKHRANDPKGILNWWTGHDSSMLAPSRLDTSAELNAHPFWDIVLPIFDKYYDSCEASFDKAEIEQDIHALSALRQYNDLKLEDLFLSVDSVSFGAGPRGAEGHRSSNRAAKPLHYSQTGKPCQC